MKNIALIEPQNDQGHLYNYTSMPRLGLPLIGAQLCKEGYEVSIYKGAVSGLPWGSICKSDLVGISSTTSTSGEAYRMAAHLYSQNIPVVLGGIHVTFMPDEALQYADYVMRGEADFSFPLLVRALEKGEALQSIPGLSFRLNGVNVHNPAGETVDMNCLPIPDLSLFHGNSSLPTVPVMTSRGCPYNCTFCTVTPMFGRRYRYRSTEKVLQELSLYQNRHVFFCDDNFAADRGHTKRLLQGMLDEGISLKGWGAQVCAEAAKDDELLELMRRTGGDKVYVGFESINPATLRDYNKKQSVEDIRESIRRFHEYRIRVHGMFVLGGDSDTVDTIRETVDFSLESRIDTVQFMVLTPLPGSGLFEKLQSEERILTKDWELYDGHHVVFQPTLMSPENLQLGTVRAFKRFYSVRHLFQNVFLTGWHAPFYRAFGWWMARYFGRHIRLYTRVLKEMQSKPSREVSLLNRRVPVSAGNEQEGQPEHDHLNISIYEKGTTYYLQLRGWLNDLTLKELSRAVKDKIPHNCFCVVINAEELHFLSPKTALSFARFLKRLGKKAHRLRLVYREDGESWNIIKKSKNCFARFELLPGRR